MDLVHVRSVYDVHFLANICHFLKMAVNTKKMGKTMLAKNKHHTRKKHGPNPWAMGFPGDPSLYSRKN